MAFQISRRGAVIGIGSLGLALSATGCSYASKEKTLPWTPTALDDTQAHTLHTMADLIIPKTDTPGALDLDVPAFVDRAIADWCSAEDATMILSGLDQVEKDAKDTHNKSFVDLKTEDQIALLEGYDLKSRKLGFGQKDFFLSIRDLVTIGYFTSEIGATEVLNYDPVPGGYKGCVPLTEIGTAWATT